HPCRPPVHPGRYRITTAMFLIASYERISIDLSTGATPPGDGPGTPLRVPHGRHAMRTICTAPEVPPGRKHAPAAPRPRPLMHLLAFNEGCAPRPKRRPANGLEDGGSHGQLFAHELGSLPVLPLLRTSVSWVTSRRNPTVTQLLSFFRRP